jgi:hypothetical protein
MVLLPPVSRDTGCECPPGTEAERPVPASGSGPDGLQRTGLGLELVEQQGGGIVVLGPGVKADQFSKSVNSENESCWRTCATWLRISRSDRLNLDVHAVGVQVVLAGDSWPDGLELRDGRRTMSHRSPDRPPDHADEDVGNEAVGEDSCHGGGR